MAFTWRRGPSQTDWSVPLVGAWPCHTSPRVHDSLGGVPSAMPASGARAFRSEGAQAHSHGWSAAEPVGGMRVASLCRPEGAGASCPRPFRAKSCRGAPCPRVALRSTRGNVPMPLRGRFRRTTGAKVPPILSCTRCLAVRRFIAYTIRFAGLGTRSVNCNPMLEAQVHGHTNATGLG